eukprot:tig00020560_g11097.t1
MLALRHLSVVSARHAASSKTAFAAAARRAAHVVPSELTRIGRLNHVAIAVPELAAASRIYRDVLGAKVSEPQRLPEHGVTVVFIELANTKFELLEPLGEESPIAAFMKKNPSGGMHHVCLEVKDVRAAIELMQASGVRVLNVEPKIGAHGKPVTFVHPKDMNGVLVELEQV